MRFDVGTYVMLLRATHWWLLLITFGLFACTMVPVRQVDPLIGHIVRSGDSHTVNQIELIELMADADVVYLGEKHDNPQQHQIQGEVIQRLLELGKTPALGFEPFSIEQTGYLLQYVRGTPSPLLKKTKVPPEERLRVQLGWGRERDQDWEFYGSLLRLGRDHELMVFGLDLPKAVRLRLARVGLQNLTRLEHQLLFPTGFSDDAYRELMYEKLTEAHCGWSSEEHVKKFYDTWVARNDAMAMAITEMLSEGVGQPIVIILGAGHTQHNRGVYERVAHLNPTVSQVNVGLREVASEPIPLAHYLEDGKARGVNFGPDHEYLWFTSRVDREDPCR